jgi:hypothetical protein
MKKLIAISFAVLSLNAIADSNITTVTGDEARNLMNALYNSGVSIKETKKGAETELVKAITCEGSYEHEVTGGLLTKERCFREASNNFYQGFQGEVLPESTTLARALGEAGAGADAAMGRWWTYASDIQCIANYDKKLEIKCSFKAE